MSLKETCRETFSTLCYEPEQGWARRWKLIGNDSQRPVGRGAKSNARTLRPHVVT